MNWNDLKKCDINDIVGYINEKLIKYKSLKKVSDKLEINESTIRKYLNSKGYRRKENQFVLLEYTCNPRSNTAKNKENNSISNHDDISNIDVISTPKLKENMLYISQETETLKEMIEWFKINKTGKSNSDVIELREGINIDLPEAPIKRTTIRINEKIWDEFDILVEENKPYDKHDLMGQALKEFIDRYKK
ncbi:MULTISPECIES: hypothetical protein [unclassified Clostridioides]|uniref:hypothetical protein n=2 Tax=Clostridioides TaxID=1870884 RepID=UPI001D12C5D3|nr:hypothetical protein [Clostridioides sp. ZZV14-6154]MCC0666270.1 hypothetical protein [Clostridioides sp. ZZV15-6597]MCC0670357.1 hypothetical protein [Clostridioides sp. ZZV14-6153]MCC0724670.1 hypothetical protein [Clostridioides sp. ZZV14-6104]